MTFMQAYRQRRAQLLTLAPQNLEYGPTFRIRAYGSALARDPYGVIVGEFLAQFAYTDPVRGYVVEWITVGAVPTSEALILRQIAEIEHGIVIYHLTDVEIAALETRRRKARHHARLLQRQRSPRRSLAARTRDARAHRAWRN